MAGADTLECHLGSSALSAALPTESFSCHQFCLLEAGPLLYPTSHLPDRALKRSLTLITPTSLTSAPS